MANKGVFFAHIEFEHPVSFVFLDKNTLDITNSQAVKEVLASQSFAVCINAAAYTDVDGAETNKEFAYAINTTAVETLAKVCKQHGCWLVHISTDYVYHNSQNTPFVETDTTNPQGVYAQTKL